MGANLEEGVGDWGGAGGGVAIGSGLAEFRTRRLSPPWLLVGAWFPI